MLQQMLIQPTQKSRAAFNNVSRSISLEKYPIPFLKASERLFYCNQEHKKLDNQDERKNE